MPPPAWADGFSDVTIVAGQGYVTAVGNDRSALLTIGPGDGTVRRSVALPQGSGTPLVTDGRVVVKRSTGLLVLA